MKCFQHCDKWTEECDSCVFISKSYWFPVLPIQSFTGREHSSLIYLHGFVFSTNAQNKAWHTVGAQ